MFKLPCTRAVFLGTSQKILALWSVSAKHAVRRKQEGNWKCIKVVTPCPGNAGRGNRTTRQNRRVLPTLSFVRHRPYLDPKKYAKQWPKTTLNGQKSLHLHTFGVVLLRATPKALHHVLRYFLVAPFFEFRRPRDSLRPLVKAPVICHGLNRTPFWAMPC